MERHWNSVQDWLGSLLEERGVDRISAEELTVPPGMDELFSLLWIKRHHEEGEFDCVIVDCAPTGETLRLLSFPDVVTWWLERILPSQRRLAPFARTLFDMPLPGDGVFDDVERLARNLVAMNDILRDRERTTVRLVMNPDRMVVKEAMRTFTYLNLYGYLTDAVVVNRLLPAEGYFADWSRGAARAARPGALGLRAGAGADRAATWSARWSGPRCSTGWPARCSASGDPAAILHAELSQQLVTDNGRATLRVDVPFAEKGDLSLKKIGLEVIVRVGPQKRTIMLPPALAAYSASGARFEDGTLEISLREDQRCTLSRCATRAAQPRRRRTARAVRPRRPVRAARRHAQRRPARAPGPGHEPDPRVPAHAALADRLVPRAARHGARASPRSRTSRSSERLRLPAAGPARPRGRRRGGPPARRGAALAGAAGRRRRPVRPAGHARPPGTLVAFVYPRTGTPGQPLVPGWDDIPGARGCTPQSCAFRDRHDALDGARRHRGRHQRDGPGRAGRASPSARRITYPLLNDGPLRLRDELGLPTFDVHGTTLYKRLTFVARGGRIEKVFYPVFPPDRNAAEVEEWLRGAGRSEPRQALRARVLLEVAPQPAHVLRVAAAPRSRARCAIE